MNASILKSAAIIAAAASLAACTNDRLPSDNGNLTLGPGEDVIRISISNTTDTRAARPISSNKGENNINRIAFKFFEMNNNTPVDYINITGLIDDEGNDVGDYTAEGTVLALTAPYSGTMNIVFDGLEPESTYKIIAYGYNQQEEGSYEFPYTLEPRGENYQMTCTTLEDPIEEVFAGTTSNSDFINVNQHGKFTQVPVIELTRQVAGMLAYFQEVPAFADNQRVYKITVSGKAKVSGFYFPANLGKDEHYNGIMTEDWAGTEWINYLTFDLEKGASNFNDTLYPGDTYEFNDSYLLAEETPEIEELECNKNTLFGSCFLAAHPEYKDFGTLSNCATLNICYWGEDETEPLLTVPLRKSGTDEGDEITTTSYQYGIYCNNFYSIGKKTDIGGDPNDNEPLIIDEPTGYDNAEITIHSGWILNDLIN